jgi:ribose-phosphate pyrophosphokinase
MSSDDKDPLAALQDRVDQLEREVRLLRANKRSVPGIKLFALNGSERFGQEIADHLHLPLEPHQERYHPDQEVYVRPMVNVRRSVVFVIASLYSDRQESVNDKLAKLKYLVGALWDASAAEINVVVPYIAYSRSDRKVQSREPVITKYLAKECAAVKVDRLLTMDVHSLQAFQNAHHEIRTDNLTCKVLFAEYFAKALAKVDPKHIAIVSPDSGSFTRCDQFRHSLMHRLGPGIGMAWVDKKHTDTDAKGADNIIGDVRPVMLVFDDMIATGSTLALASKLAVSKGAEQVWCAATHGLFVGKANQWLADPTIHKIVVSDTIEPFRLNKDVLAKVEIVPTTQLWAEAIRRTHTGESLSGLFTL